MAHFKVLPHIIAGTADIGKYAHMHTVVLYPERTGFGSIMVFQKCMDTEASDPDFLSGFKKAGTYGLMVWVHPDKGPGSYKNRDMQSFRKYPCAHRVIGMFMGDEYGFDPGCLKVLFFHPGQDKPCRNTGIHQNSILVIAYVIAIAVASRRYRTQFNHPIISLLTC
jgi:hypothetical protein